MTTPPRRLKDDPDFLWETGCDMADEAFAVGGYDLADMRARVLSETQPPSAGAPLRKGGTWGPTAALVGGAAVLLALGGLLLGGVPGSGSDEEMEIGSAVPSTQQAEQAEGEAVLPVVAPASHGQADAEKSNAPVPSATMEDEVPAAAPRQAPTRSAPVAAAAPAGDADAPEDEAPSGPSPGEMAEPAEPAPAAEPPTPRSTLAEEVAAYDAAQALAEQGAVDEAIVAFEDYLASYPDGRLQSESQLALLRAYVAAGSGQEVESLVVALLSEPGLAAKRDELLRIRTENLVLSGQCDTAMDVARDLPTRDAARIRRACRWKE